MNLDAIAKRATDYRTSHDHLGAFACCKAHASADDVPALVARVRELEEENAKLRLYLSHAVKFSFGTDMASHAEVTRAEQNRPDGDWFFRSWGPTERHATQEAELEAALELARENGGTP
jgi:hypothetical protein